MALPRNTPPPPRLTKRPTPNWPAPHRLPLTRGARLAWRQLGNGRGTPWLVLHGGPGSGSNAALLAPFELATQRVILPDQRGAGASTPRGALNGSHTAQLVADLERLRQHLGLARWHVLAGSWGTVLALAYAQHHPQRVASLVLRGGFTLSRREIDGLLAHVTPRVCHASRVAQRARLSQVMQFGTLPVATQQLRAWQLAEQVAVLRGQWRAWRHTPTGAARNVARRAWARSHQGHRRHRAARHAPVHHRGDHAQAIKFHIQARYLMRRGFMRPGALERAVRQLAQQAVPVDWVHGRFDAVCPPANSRRWLAVGQAAAREAGTPLPHAHWPLAGHLGGEPALLQVLRAVVRP